MVEGPNNAPPPLADTQTAVSDASARPDVFHEMFRESILGKLIYEWTAPPDVGSFAIVAVNPAASRVAGRNLEPEIGRTIAEVGSPLLATEIPARYAAAIERRELQRFQYVRELPGLPRAVFEGRCFPLYERRIGVAFEDVTEKQAMVDRIARHVKELERSNRELDDFAYVASHDLKAPLRDIDNLATWIAEDASDRLPPASLRHLSTLRDRIGRMERLLDDLLEYSRAGRIVVPAHDLVASEVVTDAIHLAGSRDGFVVRSTGDASLRTPRAPLVQVVRNLVANAMKHHDRGAGHIDVAIEDLGERVRFTVTDDGPGIPADCRQRIFRMFQTLRPRDEVEGSGMGLAIVKKLVEAHGGRVEVTDARGRGSAFSFDWPKRWEREGT